MNSESETNLTYSTEEISTEINNIENIEKEVIKNKKDRISLPILSKYERIRLLSERTRQILEGAKVLIRTSENLSAYELAKLELKHKVMPLKIVRERPDNKIEIWELSELN